MKGGGFTDAGTTNTEKKPSFGKRFRNALDERKILTRGTVAVLIIFAVSLAVYITARFSVGFAEFWARYPSQYLRAALAFITNFLPISLAESFVLMLPLLGVVYCVASSRAINRVNTSVEFYRWLKPLICFILVIASLFLFAFGPCYFRRGLADNIGLDEKNVSAEELYETAVMLVKLIDEEKSKVAFDGTGASRLPDDYDKIVEDVNNAYDKYTERNDYISTFRTNAKPLIISEYVTYTHISGMYSFFTGEANININYPDFILPFTVAHEMAHQRGIAKENEANMVAFLVCFEEGSTYLRYSALMNAFQYVKNALSAADSELYKKLYAEHVDNDIRGEFISYSLFFDKYRDNIVHEAVDTVNDTFLSSQGQSAGTKSYGLVVDLIVAYFDR